MNKLAISVIALSLAGCANGTDRHLSPAERQQQAMIGMMMLQQNRPAPVQAYQMPISRQVSCQSVNMGGIISTSCY
jgi:outer membrane lipoprotein SlyB